MEVGLGLAMLLSVGLFVWGWWKQAHPKTEDDADTAGKAMGFGIAGFVAVVVVWLLATP